MHFFTNFAFDKYIFPEKMYFCFGRIVSVWVNLPHALQIKVI